MRGDLDVTPVLREHRYRHDGLLEVNAEGPHPIYELIARAEATWEQKLKAASKTLPEAVREYGRRYGRAPPLGFDLWWVKFSYSFLDDEQINSCLGGIM